MMNIIKQQVNESVEMLIAKRNDIICKLIEKAINYDISFDKNLVVSYDAYVVDEKVIIELVFAGSFNQKEISRIASLFSNVLTVDFEYDTWGFNYC